MSLLTYNPSTGIYKPKTTPVYIPDDLSIYDFVFSYHPPRAQTNYDVPAPTRRSTREARASKPWLVDALTGRSLTAAEVESRTCAIAKFMYGGVGLRTDDAVAVFSGNEIDFATSVWAAFRIGSIVTAANPSYGPEELAYQLDLVKTHHQIKLLLVAADTVAVAVEALQLAGLSTDLIVVIAAPASTASSAVKEAASRYPLLDDIIKRYAHIALPPIHKMKPGESKSKIAFLSFSSGTTGKPKAVVIPHYALIANVLQSTHHWQSTGNYLSEKDSSLYMDSTVYVLNKFTLPDFCGSVQRHKITTLYSVPPVVIALVKSPSVDAYDLSSLRIGMTGAAPLTEEIGLALKKRLPNLVFGQGYGMTETVTIITVFNPEGVIPQSSAGTLAPNLECKVINTAGKAVGWGEIGELWSRSPSNATGYLANVKATEETFDSEGFVHTGDEVYFSRDGWLYVVDRIKELIKVSGNQMKLEGFLLGHADVADVCVIGIPHDVYGEVPRAFVALSVDARARIAAGEITEELVSAGIKAFVAAKKIRYKHLTGGVQFLDSIPKTASGKLLRRELRVLHAATLNEKREKL